MTTDTNNKTYEERLSVIGSSDHGLTLSPAIACLCNPVHVGEQNHSRLINNNQ